MTAGPLAQCIARNVKRLRQQRGLAHTVMSARLAELGRPIARLGLAEIEKGRRRVDADDLAAIATVLGVANPWDLTAETCETCGNAPPAGFGCLSCGVKAADQP